MSHSTNAKMNKHQKHPKVQTEQYLYNSGEPQDTSGYRMSDSLEFEMLDDSYEMKQRIRRHAKRMRDLSY